MEYEHMSRAEAMQTLGLEDVPFSDAENANRSPATHDVQSPPKKWQESAMRIVERAEKYLWHPNSTKGKQALEYLHSRGLKDETIKKARIGYVPLMSDGSWYSGSFEDWGLSPEQYPTKDCVKVPDGILFPYFVSGAIWKLEMRRPGEKKMPKGQVIGSVNALYNVDSLQYGEICMMVEGPLDCLSVMQEAGDLVNCVATGSADACRTQKWITELSLASFILQCFDEDKPGDNGAEYWLNVFEQQEKIERWTTAYWKDPNELLQKQLVGDSILEGKLFELRHWVELGVDLALHDLSLQADMSTPARETLQAVEDHFDISEEDLIDAAAW